jgi:thiol-disulfide isomerase/thioredoxin
MNKTQKWNSGSITISCNLHAVGTVCLRAICLVAITSSTAAFQSQAMADAAGDAMLDKCIQAEIHTSTMQANFTLQGSDITPTHGELYLKKPNIAHIVVSHSGSSGTIIAHSDGNTLMTYSTEDKQFSREPADTSGGNLTRDCEVLEAAAFFNPDLLDRMRFGHKAKLVATATLLGTPCRVVQVNGDGGSVWKVFIGPDNLLRGYSQKVRQGDKWITRESRVTGLRSGAPIPSAMLAWNLPKGAQSVEEVAKSRNTPSSGTGSDEMGLLAVGKAAPGFSLPMMGGADVTLATAVKANRATLVNFWSSFCGPCRQELPELNKMLAQYHDKGFDILSVNLGDDSKTVSKIWSEGKFSMHAVLNGDKVSAAYHVEAIPTNYVIGPDGKIMARFVGFDEQGIRSALAKAGVK